MVLGTPHLANRDGVPPRVEISRYFNDVKDIENIVKARPRRFCPLRRKN
jgi:hypothetical protein